MLRHGVLYGITSWSSCMTIQGQASLLARVITAAAVVVTAITATATAAMLPALYRRSIASVVTAGIASALLGPRRPGAVQCLATTTSDLPPEPNRRRRLYDLRGKNVMVTGATTGIGRACAWAFAAEGSNLIIVGTSAPPSPPLRRPDGKPGTSSLLPMHQRHSAHRPHPNPP